MSISTTAGERAGAAAWAREALPELALALAWLFLIFYRLGGAAPWWDEGWTMSVAHSLATRGEYARLLAGEPVGASLSAAPQVVGLVALGFQLFGVGVWQARLLPALCTAGALLALYALARGLYGRGAARGALLALLLLVPHPALHPLLIGRQVLAETPMLLALLAGYLALHRALRAPAWLLLAVPAFALAARLKAQTLPFWALSLLAPMALCLVGRRWRWAAVLGAALAGGYLGLRYVVLPLEDLALAGRTFPGQPLSGLNEAVALVLRPFNRLYTLRISLLWLLPFFAGLCAAALAWLRRARAEAADPDGLARLALIVFAGAWWGWYLGLSVGAPRYLFPALFVSAPFLGALLAGWTGGFRWRDTAREAAATLSAGPSRARLGALAALLALLLYAPVTMLYMGYYYLGSFDDSLRRVAAYLNTSTPPAALIETYESELHPFLERPYHYPPDQLHVDLIRRTSLGEEFPLSYDPLAADPDYLVLGAFGRNNILYDEVLAGDAFRLIYRQGSYEVYERVRPAEGGRP